MLASRFVISAFLLSVPVSVPTFEAGTAKTLRAGLNPSGSLGMETIIRVS